MIRKDRLFYKYSDVEKDFSKSVHCWLAQYDEEDDFLSGKPLRIQQTNSILPKAQALSF